ncbi:MAG TPA: PKD domain-containing protein [Candidatus Poseidoniales archaeon]|nr:PKD domain-containing protein [Candidatus Poseidoniales archaeon]
MKKVTLLLLILFLVMGASGGYGYYFIVLEDDADEDDTDDNPMSSSPPIARINPSNPKIQANETILFSASDSTDSDGDTLTFTWIFEGDSEQYSGETIERTYPDGGDFYINLLVTDSTGLSDEAETTVNVVEDYHGEANGSVDDGESDEIEFPVKATAVSVLITYSLDDQRITGAAFPSSVTLVLNDADGSELRREDGQEEGDGSWSFSSDDVQSVGQYVFIIEGEEGTMGYEVDIDVKY